MDRITPDTTSGRVGGGREHAAPVAQIPHRKATNDIDELALARSALSQEETHALRRHSPQPSLSQHILEVINHQR